MSTKIRKVSKRIFYSVLPFFAELEVVEILSRSAHLLDREHSRYVLYFYFIFFFLKFCIGKVGKLKSAYEPSGPSG